MLVVSSTVNNILVVRVQDLEEDVYPAQLTVTNDGDEQLTATALLNVVVVAKPALTDD